MNRFDRVTSLLLLLQTRSVITAGFLSERFGVSERTIYRDIRTLENAGVPIGAEAGIGYFLEPGYRLPPVSFTLDEAASLLLGEKLLVSSLDADSLDDFERALDKVRAVIGRSDKDHLSSLDVALEVRPTGSHFPLDGPDRDDRVPGVPGEDDAKRRHPVGARGVSRTGDRWLRECRTALVERRVVEIGYAAVGGECDTTRCVEPIGLFYYSWHWHLIAWCRLREGYRDFRLDRVRSFAPRDERFSSRGRLTLRQYLDERPGRDELQEIEVLFAPEAARFVEEQRYLFGYIDEERREDGVRMRFLTPVPDYLARWLLQYTDAVEVIVGDAVRDALRRHSSRLAAHWNGPGAPS